MPKFDVRFKMAYSRKLKKKNMVLTKIFAVAPRMPVFPKSQSYGKGEKKVGN